MGWRFIPSGNRLYADIMHDLLEICGIIPMTHNKKLA